MSNIQLTQNAVIDFFENAKVIYDPQSLDYNPLPLNEEQIKILITAKEQQVKINKIFADFMQEKSIYENKPHVIPDIALETLIDKYNLDPNLVLYYGTINGIKSIMEMALGRNADINIKGILENHPSLAFCAIKSKDIRILEFLISNGYKNKITFDDYKAVIMSENKNFISSVVELFPDIHSSKEAYEVFRGFGLSNSQIYRYLDRHELIRDFVLSKNGTYQGLSDIEMKLLDTNTLNENAQDYKNVNFTNKYGFTPLHISCIAGKYELTLEMIKNGFDIYATNNNGVTALHFLAELFKNPSETTKELQTKLLDIVEEVDIDLGDGQSLADDLIKLDLFQKKIIELSNDNLFAFFKDGADLFSPSKDNGKTYIAISHGEGFWSSGIWSFSRLVTKIHPDVAFHLIDDKVLANGGEEFIKQFDAVINPGAADSYPKLEEFTKKDCPFEMKIEVHYQNMLDLTNKLDIPYLGMCAGAQHFAMYHGGTLAPLQGYSYGTHQVTFIEGTLPYFMSLTKEQQRSVLSNCHFPKVIFKGDTAHHYAAITNKLGEDMKLGAVSEDGVAMSYAFGNGIRFATQFHPEHRYQFNDDNSINQKAWLDNFIDLARSHHDYRFNNVSHPIILFETVKARLEECINLENHTSIYCSGITALENCKDF